MNNDKLLDLAYNIYANDCEIYNYTRYSYHIFKNLDFKFIKEYYKRAERYLRIIKIKNILNEVK